MKLIIRNLKDFNKEAAGPLLGSYYIFGNAIFYSTINHGIEHSLLWRQIVLKSGIFDKLDYENKKELINAPYSCDRGRVTWSGEFTVRDKPDYNKDGHFVLYGTPGCEKHKNKLYSIFGLKNVRAEVKEDWITDLHYKVLKTDKTTLKDMLQLLNKSKEDFKSTHIAQLVEDSLKKIIRKKIK